MAKHLVNIKFHYLCTILFKKLVKIKTRIKNSIHIFVKYGIITRKIQQV